MCKALGRGVIVVFIRILSRPQRNNKVHSCLQVNQGWNGSLLYEPSRTANPLVGPDLNDNTCRLTEIEDRSSLQGWNSVESVHLDCRRETQV